MDTRKSPRRNSLACWVITSIVAMSGVAHSAGTETGAPSPGGDVTSTPAATSLPPRPEAPVAAKAYEIFDAHCARCHQQGKLDRPAAGGGFDNVLDLEALANAPHRLRPGLPDASRVYTVMIEQHVRRAAQKPERGAGLDPAEVQAVRDWIAQLPPAAADGAIRANVVTVDRTPSLQLSIRSEAPTYKAGDLVSFVAEASGDCHLTLISVDKDGLATVIFPNDLERNNRLIAGKPLRVPGEQAGYQLRLDEKGTETIVAVCTLPAAAPAGIVHRLASQRFTVLGDWRSFISSALVKQREAAKPRKVRRGRRGRRRTVTIPAPDPRSVFEVRTAIVIKVE